MAPSSKAWGRIVASGDMLFGLACLAIVMVLIFPLPPILLDLLLTISLAISVVIILTIAYLKQPMDFYVFPTVLLVVTLFRLGMNIATTRAILSGGDAGRLIETFGNFVLQGNLGIGLVVFAILTIINFVVITRGAGRVAEVSARFTLDAMPGKQMSIDADLNAGLISEKDARERRKGLEQEASFYGAMDGSSKFVRGDAVAGLLITVINLVGGFVVGMLQMGMTAEESLRRFSLLSVGDGLVAQVPGLLISTAAGILVTRSSSSKNLGEDVVRQMVGSKKVVMATGGLLVALALVPGFPWMVMLALGACFGLLGRALPKPEELEQMDQRAKDEARVSPELRGKQPGAPGAPGAPAQPQGPEVLAVEIGFDLLPIAQKNLQNLLDRITALRRNLSREYGVNIPTIAIRDNTTLPPHEYQFLMRTHTIATGELFLGQLLAMGVGNLQRPLRGRVTTEPAFGLPATWILEGDRREAERMGYAVVDPVSVLITHLSETIKANLADLLPRQEVQVMLDGLKETHPALLQEMNTQQVGLGVVHRVLQNLLREQVSVRELPLILEKLCDQIGYTKNIDELGEACRKALILEIGRSLELHAGKLNCITLHPELEQSLVKCIRQTAQEVNLILDPSLAKHVHDQLAQGIQIMAQEGSNPLVLCAPVIRLGLKRFFGESFPLLKVLAYNEVAPRIALQPVATVRPMMPMMAAA
jgi:flagellar biosynthesis protein FlhA